jgi:uncharacterized protein YndB with AHSA1/START domain
MGFFTYEASARSGAPPDRVFDLLADATTWSQWLHPLVTVANWEVEGTPPPGGVGAIRRVGRPPLFAREQIVASDPPHQLSYTILSGQPVRNYLADVSLTPDGPGTRITWRGTFEPVIPGTGPALAVMYHRLLAWFARRLAAYATADLRA